MLDWYRSLRSAVFLLILMYAVWQDIRYQEIGSVFLSISGMAGLIFCILLGRSLKMTVLSVLVGAVLLGLHMATRGGIGEGDGWFFVVTGLYLEPEENLLMLVSGILFCGLFSLTLSAMILIGGGKTGKRRIPFLPYLLPAGLWLVLF